MNKRRYFILFIIPVFCIVIYSLHAKATMTPSLDEIVANVIHASTSSVGYQVEVKQTILEGAAKKKADGETLTQAAPASFTHSFLQIYDAEQGMSTRDVTVEETATTESNRELHSATAKSSQSGVRFRIRVDIKKLMHSLQQLDQVNIESILIDGREFFRIAGQRGDGTEAVGSIVLIDSDHWYVSEQTVTISGETFYYAKITYRSYEDFWLPTRIVFNFLYDGSEVVQEFDKYIFRR